MRYSYKPKGTCSTEISFDLDDGRVTNIRFQDGCEGNLKAVAILADGLPPEEIIEKCSSITCGRKETSCADQLAIAIRQALNTVQ